MVTVVTVMAVSSRSVNVTGWWAIMPVARVGIAAIWDVSPLSTDADAVGDVSRNPNPYKTNLYTWSGMRGMRFCWIGHRQSCCNNNAGI